MAASVEDKRNAYKVLVVKPGRVKTSEKTPAYMI
jgi:hypothetical protein